MGSNKINEFLDEFKTFLLLIFDAIDDETIIRHRKTYFTHIFFSVVKMVINNKSHSLTVGKLRIDGFANMTSQAIQNKINDYDFWKYFQIVNQFIILKYFPVGNTGTRKIAVDCSKISLSKKLQEEGFPVVGNGYYCHATLSACFDIDNQIPLDYELTSSRNERSIFFDQFIKLPMTPDDAKYLSIFDRGYFSNKLLNYIICSGNDFLIRVSCNLKIVKKLNELGVNDYITKYRKKKVRVIKYSLPEKQYKIAKNSNQTKYMCVKNNPTIYYLVTTLLDKNEYPIEKLIEMYHQRWSVEENFKRMKGKFRHGTYHFENLKPIKCEIYAHQFINIITRLFQKLLDPPKKEERHFNFKSISDHIINDIYPIIFFEKQLNLVKIVNILKECSRCLITVKPNRSVDHVKRFSTDKFYHGYKKKHKS